MILNLEKLRNTVDLLLIIIYSHKKSPVLNKVTVLKLLWNFDK